MSEPGAGWDDPPRPHDPSTINEAGASGFAVDGTDSFAIPGLPDLSDQDDPDGVVGPPYRRLIVTVGAAIIVLAIVIIIGSSGRDGSAGSVQSDDQPAPYTLPPLFGGDGDPSAGRAVDGTSATLDTGEVNDV